MKTLALSLGLVLGVSQALWAQDISDQAFQIKIINLDKVKESMAQRLQYFQEGELTSATCTSKVCCRFNWAGDKGEPVVMTKTITSVFRLDSTITDREKKTVVATQVGVGFKEVPVALTCFKPSDSPVSIPEIAESLKGIADVVVLNGRGSQRSPSAIQTAALKAR